MALKTKEFEKDPAFQALLEIEGADVDGLKKQAGMEVDTPPSADTIPPVENTVPPVDTPPPADTIPPAESPTDTVPPVEKPKNDQQPPNQDGAFLKEIFGDRYKTIEEANDANISGIFDEAETLRKDNAELKTKLEAKPKTNFANDEMALYNEFVKETGQSNYGLFEKINSTELATMDPMEALVAKYILDNPNQAGQEDMVRKFFVKKYDMDPDHDEETLSLNKFSMEADGATAKKSLQEIKEKLKIPEPSKEPAQPKVKTPEEIATLEKGWNDFGTKAATHLSKLQIPIKDGKESLLDYEISESEKKEVADYITNFAAKNQMELTKENADILGKDAYQKLMIRKLPEIVHSVFEKAREMTEAEVHNLYSNPSPLNNKDTPPPTSDTTQSDYEKRIAEAAEKTKAKLG
jgi:hypothetical protein